MNQITDESAALAPSEHAMRVELQAQVNRLTWQLESERSRLRDHMVLVGKLQRERDDLKTQLTQADRDIATAIERARVAEAHVALAKKEMHESNEKLAASQAEVARWSVLANDHQDALNELQAHIRRIAPCGLCSGSGVSPDSRLCYRCAGKGWNKNSQGQYQ